MLDYLCFHLSITISDRKVLLIFRQAIVEEDSSGDVIAVLMEIQQLKKEASRLRGLANEEAENLVNNTYSKHSRISWIR